MRHDEHVTEWTACWVTGPEAGTHLTVPVGRHVVGRAGSLRTAAAGAAHHVVLDLAADGAARALVLAPGAEVHREGAAVVLRIGEATVELRPGHTDEPHRPLDETPSSAPPAAVSADGCLVRRPRVVPRWEAPDLSEPQPPAPLEPVSGGLTPAIVGLVGAAAMATLLHQPMFLLFGAMGTVVAVSSWATQRVAAHRRARRQRREYEAATAAFTAAVASAEAARIAFVTQRVPTTLGAVHLALPEPAEALWARRPADGDAFVVGVGTELTGPLPVEGWLGAGARLLVHGDDAMGVALGLVAQVVTSTGPADVRIVVVTERPASWSCLDEVPHLATPSGSRGVVAPDELAATLEEHGATRQLLLVTDDVDALGVRTSALRRCLRDGHALLAVGEGATTVPQLCTATLQVRRTGPGEWRGEWRGDATGGAPTVPVRPTALSADDAGRLAAALGALRDPEDDTTGRLPGAVTLESLVGEWDAARIASGWAAASEDGRRRPRATIGVAADGTVDVDLVRDGPHALLAGTTGAGKSELLRSLVVGLAAAAPPEELQMVLVDYKGGATFDALARLPHVAAVVSDLDERLGARALRALHAELRRRERLLRDHHVDDLERLDRRAVPGVPARLVVIVDEFAALVAEQPTFLHSLVGVAQRGRSLGVHLLLATQRPAGIVSDDIRANTNLRIALRVHDTADAVDVVGDALPATLPRRLPGRGVIRLGADELLAFQSARLADVDAAVAAISEAAVRAGSVSASPPWPPALPTRLGPEDVPGGAVGWCDDPDGQRRVPLEWDGEPLLVLGSPGSGVTTTLTTLVEHAVADPTVHAFVLTSDAAGTTGHPHPRVISVPVHDTARVMQLLHRLATSSDRHRVVLAVDGIDEVRRALDDPATADELAALDAALADPALTVLVGCAHPARVPLGVVGRCGRRWVLHLHDPADASMVGVGSAQVPPRVPGRAWVHELGLEAQLVLPAAALHAVGGARRIGGRGVARPLEGVPSVLPAAVLPPGARSDGALDLPVGMGVRTGSPRSIALPEGDHVLVLGAPGSGRSTSLHTLASAWRQATAGGRVLAVLPRRSAFDRRLATSVHRSLVGALDELRTLPGTATALVVDDAELTDDPSGELAALVAARATELTVFAAARGEALRQRYGHWTAPLRAGRTGVVGTSTAYEDGDLLGAVLPRRAPLPARPGLVWVTDHDGTELVQMACHLERVAAPCAVASAR